jgi:hypothetical protein
MMLNALLTESFEEESSAVRAIRLYRSDEVMLMSYLRNPPIAAVFGASPFGAMLDRARESALIAPCRRCGGRWRYAARTDGTMENIEWTEGTGWKPSRKVFGRLPYDEALRRYRRDQVKAEKWIVVGESKNPAGNAAVLSLVFDDGRTVITREQLETKIPCLPEEVCVRCDECQGTGVVFRVSRPTGPITARPTGSSTPRSREPTVNVSFSMLRAFLQVTRILGAVASEVPAHRQALEEYYSPGSSVLKDPDRASKDPIGGIEAVGDLFDVDPALGLAAARAARLRPANDLYDAACASWNSARWRLYGPPPEARMA